jgi:hypothetical protein
MAVCDTCNKNFNLFGVHENGYSFCSANCQNQAHVLLKSLDRLSPQEIESYIGRVHSGTCRQCGKPGPVDFYQSFRVLSVILLTRWNTQNHFVCRACARSEQLKSLGYSALLGWWGFPFGLIVTPIQIIRNMIGLSGGPDPQQPSARLSNVLKLNLARQVAAESKQG